MSAEFVIAVSLIAIASVIGYVYYAWEYHKKQPIKSEEDWNKRLERYTKEMSSIAPELAKKYPPVLPGEGFFAERLKKAAELEEAKAAEKDNFMDLTPDEFEDAVCKLFNTVGYNLSVTQRSKDGGIDLDGRGAGLGQARVVVQCKRYSSPVGVSAVRELFGVVSDDPEIAEGFLVTTSTFTQEAQAFARGKRITLVDGAELEMRFSKLADSGFR